MADRVIKTCVDVYPPGGVQEVQPASIVGPTPTVTPEKSQLAIVVGKKWRNHSTLTVAFMDGDPVVQAKVARVAAEWSKYASIRFKFVEGNDADIRISFQQPGSWSYIGTDARAISRSQPTMNFGWLTPSSSDDEYTRVVIHEFGHALGLIHEHQNPAGDIPWNKEAVYDYYGGPPNNWTRQQVDINLFQKYEKDQVRFSGFDPASIMLYPIPNEFTNGDFEVGWNKVLSQTDKTFIGSMYPKPSNEIIIDAPAREESIGEFGEVDTFTFVVNLPGRYRMETTGRTDLVMSLFGPEDDTNFIAEDDDSGRRLNPRLVRDLEWGEYTLRVQHFSKRRTGDYSIAVTTEKDR